MASKDTAYDRTLKAWAKDFEKEHLDGKCDTCKGEGKIGGGPYAIEKCPDCKGKGTQVSNIRRLINLAHMDLMYGPNYTEDTTDPESDWHGWPGFETACVRISAALSDVPSELYIDTDCESWSTSAPEGSSCSRCNGEGEVEETCGSGDEEETETVKCDECCGDGYIEPYTQDTYLVNRKKLIGAIVGKELVEYVI